MVVGAPPPARARAPRAAAFADDGRRGAATRALVYGTLLAITLFIAYFVTLPRVSLCAFQVAVGHPCPGCGMTRSIVALARGDVLASLRLHPLGVLLAGALTFSFVGALVGVARGDDPAWRVLNRHGTRVALTLLALLIGIWVVRGFVVPEWSPNPIGPGIWGAMSDGD